MAGELLYVDASALVKLVQMEAESDALARELADWPDQVSSPIVEVEVRRATRRVGQPIVRAEEVLAPVSLLPLDETTRFQAGEVGSLTLLSLDAIHLASALSLGDDLGAFCCYDRRLADEARAAGLNVLSPGLD